MLESNKLYNNYVSSGKETYLTGVLPASPKIRQMTFQIEINSDLPHGIYNLQGGQKELDQLFEELDSSYSSIDGFISLSLSVYFDNAPVHMNELGNDENIYLMTTAVTSTNNIEEISIPILSVCYQVHLYNTTEGIVKRPRFSIEELEALQKILKSERNKIHKELVK